MKITILLIILAIFLKTIFLFSIFNYDPSLKVPDLDSKYYLDLAKNIKKGIWIPQPEGYYFLSPGYSFFLGLIPYKEGNYLPIYLIQMFFGAISVGLIKQLGTNLFGKKTGILAALFFLFYGPVTFYELRILSESILSFLVLLFFLFFYSKKTILRSISGFILGILYILRPNLLLFWIFLLILAILKNRKRLKEIIFGLPFLFIIPVINFIGSGKILGTSAQAGIAFYMGNNQSSYGLFSNPIGFRGDIDEMAKQVNNYVKLKTGKEMTPFQINIFWINKTFEWAKKNPLAFLNNLVLKIQRTIDNWEYGLNEQWERKNPKAAYLFPIPFALLISGAICGLILSKNLNFKAPLFLFFLSQIMVLLIFYPSSRHRFVLIPILCLWAGFFFENFFILFKKNNFYLMVIFGVILIFSILGVPDERRNYDSFLQFNQSRAFLSLGDFQSANDWIDRAIKNQWDVSFFHLTKAEILELKGNYEKARKEKWYAFYLGASDVPLLNELGKWALENKKYKAAEKVFLRSIEVYPKNPAGAINLSQVLYIQNEIEKARYWYLKGIELGGIPIPEFEKLLKIERKIH